MCEKNGKNMGIITSLSLQKNKTRANIYLDGKFVCGLDNETIVKNRLKVGEEISTESLEKMQAESEINKAFEKALSLIERQLYSKKQLETKLKEKGYLPETINITLNKLVEYGYLNDALYAQNYVGVNKNKSRKEIKYKLMQKGINANTIDEVVNKIDTETERDNAVAIAEKYMRRKENTKENINKLFAYLIGKGFAIDDAKFAIKKYNKEIDYD